MELNLLEFEIVIRCISSCESLIADKPFMYTIKNGRDILFIGRFSHPMGSLVHHISEFEAESIHEL